MTYFITGSSGVGKSTLVKEIRKANLDNLQVHDFDELGVPLDADQTWRIETTKKWLIIAKENILKNISTIVIGLTHPNEVNEIAEMEGIQVRYCMLEVQSEELKRRLIALRFSSSERIENLKKYEGVTPDQFFDNNKKHVEEIKNEALERNATFIETTNISPQETAKKVLNWISLSPAE